MAQTTAQMSFANAKIEIKIAAGAWTDIGGEHTKTEVDGGERKSGEAFTQTGDTPHPDQRQAREVHGEGFGCLYRRRFHSVEIAI